MSQIRSVTSHTLLALAEAGIIAALVLTLIVAPALAAKGGGGKPGGSSGGTGTISLVLLESTDGLAHFGQKVTFNVSTTATNMPYVHLQCSQNGALVAEARQGYFETALGNQWFYLGPTPAWQGGDADCTAYLEKYTSKGWQVLGSTSFHVYP